MSAVANQNDAALAAAVIKAIQDYYNPFTLDRLFQVLGTIANAATIIDICSKLTTNPKSCGVPRLSLTMHSAIPKILENRHLLK